MLTEAKSTGNPNCGHSTHKPAVQCSVYYIRHMNVHSVLIVFCVNNNKNCKQYLLIIIEPKKVTKHWFYPSDRFAGSQKEPLLSCGGSSARSAARCKKPHETRPPYKSIQINLALSLTKETELFALNWLKGGLHGFWYLNHVSGSYKWAWKCVIKEIIKLKLNLELGIFNTFFVCYQQPNCPLFMVLATKLSYFQWCQ